MINEKFSMTNFQFRLSALVAACRAVAWPWPALALGLLIPDGTVCNRPRTLGSYVQGN